MSGTSGDPCELLRIRKKIDKYCKAAIFNNVPSLLVGTDLYLKPTKTGDKERLMMLIPQRASFLS
jgi:hypothetical protein